MVATMAMPLNFCTTREAAKKLGISLRTAQLWTESGLLDAWKTSGGHRRISLESVERLLAKPGVAEKAMNSAADAVQLKILVVEDDPLLLELYRRVIAGWAIRPRVTLARNGFEGLVRIGQECPDVVLTDLNMPGMDGFEMLRNLRSMPDLGSVSVVVVTGLSDAEIAAQGTIPAGIPVLQKPVDFPRLEKLVLKLAGDSLAAKNGVAA